MSDVKLFRHISPKDKEAITKAQHEVLDMVRAQVEAGNVESLMFFLIGPDPKIDGEKAYTGGRWLCHPSHLDLAEDLWNQFLDFMAREYGFTPSVIRAMRGKTRAP